MGALQQSNKIVRNLAALAKFDTADKVARKKSNIFTLCFFSVLACRWHWSYAKSGGGGGGHGGGGNKPEAALLLTR